MWGVNLRRFLVLWEVTVTQVHQEIYPISYLLVNDVQLPKDEHICEFDCVGISIVLL